jgi:hypothetical protein
MVYVTFRYEYEGFDLGDSWYLPDFWLPENQAWLEIKGAMPTDEERNKVQQLAIGTGYPAAIFGGDVWWHTPGYLYLPQRPKQVFFPCFWAACNICHSVGIILEQTPPPTIGAGMCKCWQKGISHPGKSNQTAGSRAIAAAFQAARQARFE